MRETGRSGVAAYLVKRIKEAGGHQRKVEFPGHRGAPDRLVGVYNFSGFIETKATNGHLEPHQIREHKFLTGLGFAVVTLFTKAEVDCFIGTQSAIQKINKRRNK